MNGRIIGIKIYGEFVPCETSCDISIDGERIGTSSSEKGNWRTSIAGYRSWKVGVNGNLTIDASPAGAMKLIQAIIDGQNVMLIMTMRVTNAETFIISGNASPTNISISANSTSTATWSGNFEGNGAIELDYNVGFSYFWGEIGNIYAQNPSMITQQRWEDEIRYNGTSGNMDHLYSIPPSSMQKNAVAGLNLQWWIIMIPNDRPDIVSNISSYKWFIYDELVGYFIEYLGFEYIGDVTLDGISYHYRSIRPSQTTRIRFSL